MFFVCGCNLLFVLANDTSANEVVERKQEILEKLAENKANEDTIK